MVEVVVPRRPERGYPYYDPRFDTVFLVAEYDDKIEERLAEITLDHEYLHATVWKIGVLEAAEQLLEKPRIIKYLARRADKYDKMLDNISWWDGSGRRLILWTENKLIKNYPKKAKGLNRRTRQ